MSVSGCIEKTFLYTCAILYTPWLLLHFFLDVTSYVIPWTRPSNGWSLQQAVRMRVVRLLLLYWSLTKSGDRLHLNQGREKNRFEVAAPGSPKFYKGPLGSRNIQPAQLGMTWTPARPPPPSLVGPDTIVALHFHGGAFVIGNGRDEDTGLLAQSLVRHTGCTHVCTPQYRLSSGEGGCFPASLQDALTAYLWLTNVKCIPAAQIILSGDSAGANLAIGLLRYIREHGDGVIVSYPKAAMLWSPWVSVSAALEQDMRLSPNYKTDYLTREFGCWGARTISANGTIDPAGPYLSPLKHPFRLEENLPVFVHAGGIEILCDDIRDFCKRFEHNGWNIHLDISQDCPHDILLLGDRAGFGAEANLAASRAREFLSQAAGLKLERCCV
jgi:acetyl esterase/lipase